MPILDPDAQAVLDAAIKAGAPPVETQTPEEARATVKARRAALNQPVPFVAEVRNLTAPGPGGPIPMRLYRAKMVEELRSQPCLMFFHGGGWVFGDLDTHDVTCRHLANAAECTVISVGYRLAPEHKFPAAFEDSFAATQWVAANARELAIDPDRLAVGGDSAGGNLATTVAMAAARSEGPKLTYQVLIYPVADLQMTDESYQTVGEGYLLTTKAMVWFRDHYLRNVDDIGDWRASPLRAQSFAGLPPAYVVTAGCDPLCDEGVAYAKLLEKNGIPVTYRHRPGQMHGFIGMSGFIKAADEVIADIGQALKTVWKTA